MKPTKPEKNRINLQVISIVCLGLCISISLFFVIRGYETAKTENDFKLLALDRANSIGREIENNEQALQSIYSLFRSSEYVTRDGFDEFCKYLLAYHNDIQALGWIPRISSQQREDHEREVQAEGYPDYQITKMLPQGGVVRADDSKEHFPVYYIEPYIGNEVAMGFDLSTNQERFEALCLSRDIGKAVGTSRITLVQEEGDQYGFLIFVPVYHKQASIDTIEERRANLTGLVSGVFRVGDLVEGTLGYLKGQGVDVYLFDTSNPQDVQFLYYHPSRLGHDVSPPLSLEEIKSEGLYVSTILNVAGRKWSIVCKPTPVFMKKRYIWYPWGFLIGGLLLTGFIVVCFYTISDRASHEKKAKEIIQTLNESLEQRVIERTADVAKLSQAIKHSSATIVITDAEGNIEYANPRFEQLTGYSIEEAIGKNPGILKSGKTPPDVYNELWETVKSGNEWKGEFCNRKKNGGLYWESASISPVKNAEGVITNFIAVKDDITESKQAGEALQRSNSLLSAVIESPDNVIIFVLDTSYNYLSFNMAHVKKMKEVYGADIEIGRHILSYISVEDDRLKAETNYKRVTKGESFVKIEEYGQANSRFWYELIFNPIYDNLHHITGFTVFVTDVTERRQAEETLIQSEKRLSEAQRVGKIGSFTLNVTTGIWSGTEMLYSILGIGKKREYSVEDWVEIIHPDHRDSLATYQQSVLDKKIPFNKDYLIIRKSDGETRCVYSRGELQLDDSGNVIGMIGTTQDITEHKKMEKALLQSEKLKSIGAITAGISHEFNNLLAIISGNIQLLEEDYKDDKVLADALRIIMKAADDGAEIAGNMLKFTKTSPDTKEFVSFDIRDLIRHSINFTKPRWQNEALAEGIDYKIDTEGMGRVPSIMCNPAEIREVFINIINNALDAMSGGGKISFGTWSDNETVFVNVTDDGDGISDNVKKNIFDPFFTTKGVEGTGLGMSIVYGIVTRHSGKIEVDGELGKGTAFTMQFPVTIKRRRVIKISAPEQKTNEKSLRILVIDDEESMRDILNQFLSKGGHDVKTTDNGVNVINMIEGERFDLVLCDIAMPNICGYDVVKSLNGLKKRPKIGIISGWSGSLASMADKGLTVDFFLKKPFKHEALAKYINDLEFKC